MITVQHGDDVCEVGAEPSGDYTVTLNGQELYRTNDYRFVEDSDPVFWASVLATDGLSNGDTIDLPTGIVNELDILANELDESEGEA